MCQGLDHRQEMEAWPRQDLTSTEDHHPNPSVSVLVPTDGCEPHSGIPSLGLLFLPHSAYTQGSGSASPPACVACALGTDQGVQILPLPFPLLKSHESCDHKMRSPPLHLAPTAAVTTATFLFLPRQRLRLCLGHRLSPPSLWDRMEVNSQKGKTRHH